MTPNNQSGAVFSIDAELNVGAGLPPLRDCERCGGWHGGKGQMCYKCENMKSGDRYGAYWLHKDGWFRLFPPNDQALPHGGAKETPK